MALQAIETAAFQLSFSILPPSNWGVAPGCGYMHVNLVGKWFSSSKLKSLYFLPAFSSSLVSYFKCYLWEVFKCTFLCQYQCQSNLFLGIITISRLSKSVFSSSPHLHSPPSTVARGWASNWFILDIGMQNGYSGSNTTTLGSHCPGSNPKASTPLGRDYSSKQISWQLKSLRFILRINWVTCILAFSFKSVSSIPLL